VWFMEILDFKRDFHVVIDVNEQIAPSSGLLVSLAQPTASL